LTHLDSIQGSDLNLLSLADAKKQCYVLDTEDDAFITALISVARRTVEARTWRQLIPATFNLYLDEFPKGDGIIEVWKCPVIGLTSVSYYDTNDVLQTWASSNYEVDLKSEPARIKPVNGETWPDTYEKLNAVQITYTAGYDASDSFHTIPDNLVQAMKLVVAYMFNNRDAVLVSEGRSLAVEELPMGVEALCEQSSLRECV